MKTIAIIGSGYIGTALLRFWKQKALYHLISTTTSEEKLSPLLEISDSAYLVHGSDTQKLKEVLSSVDILVVSVAPTKGASYESTYLDTAKGISQALEGSNRLKQLIYLGSTSVYGDWEGAWVNEDSPLNASSESAQILIETENHYLEHISACTSILRLGGIYGPGRDHESRVQRMAGQTWAGSGEAYCNWIHQEDVVRSIDWVFTHSLSGIYNVCATDHPKRQEFYDSLTEHMELPSIQWDASQKTTRSGNRRVSNTKLRDTGFEFLHGCSVYTTERG